MSDERRRARRAITGTWLGGLAIFVLGVVFGTYWMFTREGLGALGGPVLMMMAAALALLVMTVAVVWSLARDDPLPRPMLFATAALAVASGGVSASALWDNAATRDGIDLPVVLLAVAWLAVVATVWAWTKARPTQ